ncbi:hypothetical protein V8B97DRAFT_1869984 [Scleroderma yunnanense]
MRQVFKSSLLLFVVSYFVSSALASEPGLLDIHRPRDHQLRDLLSPGDTSAAGSSTAGPPTQTTADHSSTAPTTSTAAPSTQPTSTQPTSTAQAASTTSAPPITSAPPASSASKTVVGTTATNADGQIVTSIVTVSQPSSSSAAPTQSGSGSDSSVGSGTIIGLSVAGGVALIAIISFFIWKVTRKRFSDFDDGEAIKWPELNSHGGEGHALPTNSTGRAGFGAENESELNLARAPSPGGAYAQSVGASSIGAGPDPYAVPPLPHLNPSQPYHDDPGAYNQAGYYDPYRGPVPNTFGDVMSDHGHGIEAIPMTQMARTRSPGPQAAYDMQGRASPAPQAGYGYGGMDERVRSPNPAALGGTRSPGPHAPYGYSQ